MPRRDPQPGDSAALVTISETLDAADAYRAAGVPYPAEPDLPAQAPDVVRRWRPRPRSGACTQTVR